MSRATDTSQLVAALKVHRQLQEGHERAAAGSLWQDHGLAGLLRIAGRMIDPSRDWEEWKQIQREAEIHDGRLHDARHTAATLLLEQITLTQNTYQHVMPKVIAGATERVAEVLSRQLQPQLHHVRRRKNPLLPHHRRSQGVWTSSPIWTRTRNPSINSRMLCQLSYGGLRSTTPRTGPGTASWPHDDSASPYRGPVRSARLLLPLGLLLCALVPGSASAALGVQQTWAGNQIRLYPAISAGYDGHGITVAVLDGWVDTSHPDFQGRAIASADCTAGTCTTAVARDACGQQHGTHVAGTIAASSYGVARRARLLAIRVLAADSSGDCAGTPKAVAAGIRWAVDHGARVINLSLGPDVPGQATNSAIPDAVHDAAAEGVVVVFSAGNADLPIAQAYGSDALVVAATGPTGQLADYSQHGTGVSVAAPGGQPTSADQCTQARCITSLYPGNRYAVAAGTSMAAPHVAGLAALLLQQRPVRSRDDVVARIEGTAQALSGAGSGRIDVTAALGIVVKRPPVAKPTPTRTISPRPHSSPRPIAKATTPTAVTPSPRAVAPSPIAAPRSPTPTPVAISPPAAVEPPQLASLGDDEIPVPLAGIAGALIGLAATAVLMQSLRR